MLTGSIDGVDRIQRRLEKMAHKLDHFEYDLLHEVRDWETQDVRRHRPGAHGSREEGVAARVVFRPHSRWEMKKSAMAKRRYYGKVSTRDILRTSLLRRLIERLGHRVSESLKW